MKFIQTLEAHIIDGLTDKSLAITAIDALLIKIDDAYFKLSQRAEISELDDSFGFSLVKAALLNLRIYSLSANPLSYKFDYLINYSYVCDQLAKIELYISDDYSDLF